MVSTDVMRFIHKEGCGLRIKKSAHIAQQVTIGPTDRCQQSNTSAMRKVDRRPQSSVSSLQTSLPVLLPHLSTAAQVAPLSCNPDDPKRVYDTTSYNRSFRGCHKHRRCRSVVSSFTVISIVRHRTSRSVITPTTSNNLPIRHCIQLITY